MLWNILLPVNWLAAMVTKANEGDLLESLRNGDQKAWREVLERYGPMLIGYATRLLKSRDRAEEVVQEAIVSVHGGLERFEGRCSLKSWLFRAVHNKAIDELRRSGRFVSPPDDENGRWEERFTDRGGWAVPVASWPGSVGARIDASRVLEAVRKEMGNLPHTHRQVLLMKEVHGLSSAETCDALDISQANLRVSLHRARRALRAAVGHLMQAEA